MGAQEGGTEQFEVRRRENVEGAAAPTLETHWLAEPVEVFGLGRQGVDHGQGVEIASVAGAGDGAIAIEVGHSLVHGGPEKLPASLLGAPAPDFELARLVDDGFDTQDLAELVVHLQPVV